MSDERICNDCHLPMSYPREHETWQGCMAALREALSLATKRAEKAEAHASVMREALLRAPCATWDHTPHPSCEQVAATEIVAWRMTMADVVAVRNALATDSVEGQKEYIRELNAEKAARKHAEAQVTVMREALEVARSYEKVVKALGGDSDYGIKYKQLEAQNAAMREVLSHPFFCDYSGTPNGTPDDLVACVQDVLSTDDSSAKKILNVVDAAVLYVTDGTMVAYDNLARAVDVYEAKK